jgi:hypothetical protein
MSWVANIMAESSLCFQEWNRNSGHRCLYNSLPEIVGKLLYTSLHPSSGADKSEGSHGSSSLLFFMKVTVWHVVSDSQKVMTALLVMLPPKCRCGDFSAVSLIDYLHTHHQELMKPERRVMTAHCCCSWWRWWWSDTLWMTLMKLWLHVILVMLVFAFARTDRTVTLKLVLWRFLCNLVDVWSLFCWPTWEGFSGI